jgi:type IV fimbrial biogenesis protein FimT
MDRNVGFTLLELLVTIVVVAVLLGFVVPSFQKLLLANRLTAVANEMLGAMRYARSEAVSEKQRITLCKSTDGMQCSQNGGYDQGWIIFQDAGVLASVDGSDQLLRVFYATDDVSMLGNSPVSYYVSYVPSGEARLVSGGFQAGTIHICSGDAGRKLILSGTGRVRIEQAECT